MSLEKKVLLLLISLVILITYTVSTFSYKRISKDNNELISFSNEDSMFGEYLDLIVLKINKLKFSILKELELEDQDDILSHNNKSLSLELLKDNGIILMSGTFKDEEQVKSIVNLLNINRDGKYIFEENRVKDVVLLNKLSLLIDSFKEFFADGSKLSLENGKVLLSGELKDSNFKPILDSIIAKSNLDMITDIKEPLKSNTEKIIDNITKSSLPKLKEVSSVSEDKLNKLENIDPIEEVIGVKSKLIQDAQNRINSLTSNSKITFKRRSTNITEESKEIVKGIASILLGNSKLTVEIAGHTDSRGRAALNKKISQDRANSVKATLMSLGVNPKQIKAVGYGEDFPIAKDDAQGLSEVNRRVEFIVGESK
ncbi:MAG: hypothetical protein CL623_05420 [Arcobacter sp.]|nr:hypothetical protein [Arcobacter sp.]|tara:strand:+ start:13300 stop:14409 length:1110 start_codon:yes stop_codon:yes gene_type:complete